MSAPTDSWDSAVREHRRTVELGLLAAGAPLDLARELAHEAFARVFEQWATGRLERVELPGLVLRQAAFLLAERRREAALTHRRAGALAEAHELPGHLASPDATIAARQLLARAERALELVTPRGRQVMEAVLTSPESGHAPLAAGLGVSVQRFRQILCEVRARLRHEVGE